MWLTAGSLSALAALRVGTRTVVSAPLVAAAAAGLMLLGSTAFPRLFVAAALIGVAAALGVLPALLLAQLSVDRAHLGATTSLLVLLRNFVGALGVSATLAVSAEFGFSSSIWVLIVVTAAGALPAMMIPNRAAEAHLRRLALEV